MAKIGTAHIEIKPVLNEEALDLIAERIEAAVKAGVEAGMQSARPLYGDVHLTYDFDYDKLKSVVASARKSPRGGAQ